MRCYVDENHNFCKDLSEKIATIVYNKEFISLEAELEVYYRRTGFDSPKFYAFQDALYSFLSQDEGLKPAKAFR